MVRRREHFCRRIYGSWRPFTWVVRVIFGIRWDDLARNTEVVDMTNLPSVRDVIAERRNSLFGHVVRLDDHTPAHRACHRS